MKTRHRIFPGNAAAMGDVPAGSVELVVTSPPYPMIEMWDAAFAAQDPSIGQALERGDGWDAFRLMHALLDRAWGEVRRVLVDGGLACINIGDAVRTIGGNFALYSNHARILASLLDLGFNPLPAILWRKQTNAPNKFMGSGMLPAGAYVTLEHEYVLIVRKGAKRVFASDTAKANRRSSAFFWEERNAWFSDVWMDLKGTVQDLPGGETRGRSAAFPFELPYRLISMFSAKGDTVLDPFLGLGTTTAAAVAAGRNSIGYEIDQSLLSMLGERFEGLVAIANARIDERLRAHLEFIAKRCETAGPPGYRNRHYGFPVVTRQETDLLLNELVSLNKVGETEFNVEYSGQPQAAYRREDDRWTKASVRASDSVR